MKSFEVPTPSQSEKNGKPRLITVTLRMDDKHDVRAVRRLLKALKRGYGLECVGLCEKGQRAEG